MMVLTSLPAMGVGGIKQLLTRLAAPGFVRNVSETLAAQMVSLAIGFVTSVLVARLLGPEGRGEYAVAVAIALTGIQLGNLGLHASNTYYVAQDRSLLGPAVANTVILSAGLGIPVAAIAWALLSLWPTLVPLQGSLLLLAFIWIPFGLAQLWLQSLLLGIGAIRVYNLITMGTRISTVLLIGLLLLLGAVTPAFLVFTGLAGVVAAAVWAGWALYGRSRGHLDPSYSLVRKTIFYGLRAYSAALVMFLVTRVDLFMVQHMLGMEQAGYYSISTTMATLLLVLPTAVGTILFPKLSGVRDGEQKWLFAKKTAAWVGVIMVVSALVSAAACEPMLKIVFGPAFMPAGPAFLALLPGIPLMSVNIIFMNYFAALGMPAVTIYSPVAALIVNVMLNWWLIPVHGIAGAGLASSLSCALMLLLSVIFILSRSPRRTASGAAA